MKGNKKGSICLIGKFIIKKIDFHLRAAVSKNILIIFFQVHLRPVAFQIQVLFMTNLVYSQMMPLEKIVFKFSLIFLVRTNLVHDKPCS